MQRPLTITKTSQYRIAGAVDTGQRYVVRYKDGTGRPCFFGGSDDLKKAEEYAKMCRNNPFFTKVRVVDRAITKDNKDVTP